MMAKSPAGAARSDAPSGRSTAPARGSKPPAPAKGTNGGTPPAKPSAFATFYRAYRAEIWGLVAFVGALLSALGVYGDFGGFVGTAFRAAGVTVGWARLLVPPALAAVGVLAVSGRSRNPAEGESSDERRPSVRILGGCLVMTALAGILHLAAGRPTWGDALGDFEGAGGYVGFASVALALVPDWQVAVVVLVAIGSGWLASRHVHRHRGRRVWCVLRRAGLGLAAVRASWCRTGFGAEETESGDGAESADGGCPMARQSQTGRPGRTGTAANVTPPPHPVGRSRPAERRTRPPNPPGSRPRRARRRYRRRRWWRPAATAASGADPSWGS